ncbi:MAG TPA: DUF4349 domain-containing protein, partial [Acidimicrobiales bacterium]|nr:DUF4349 domain-containing protein [Acidimicrobiales bacterium]
MDVMDETILRAALHQAADAFEVPAQGPAAIVEAARRAEDAGYAQAAFELGDEVEGSDPHLTPPWPTRVWRTAAAHRVLSVAATVLLVAVLATAGVLLGSSNTPTESPLTTLPARAAHGAPSLAPSSTTTTPEFGVGSPSGGTANAATGSSATGSSAAGLSARAPTAPTPGVPSSASSPASSVPPLPSGEVGTPARIEQTGTLDIEVHQGRLQRVITALNFLAAANGGYVSGSDTDLGGSGSAGSGTVTLEVPVNSFDSVLKSAQALGKTLVVSSKATDVTAQYTDLQDQISA